MAVLEPGGGAVGRKGGAVESVAKGSAGSATAFTVPQLGQVGPVMIVPQFEQFVIGSYVLQ